MRHHFHLQVRSGSCSDVSVGGTDYNSGVSFRADNKNIHAHSSLLKNVSKLVKDTQVYLLAEPKLHITLEGVLSNTVHILLQFLYIGKQLY